MRVFAALVLLLTIPVLAEPPLRTPALTSNLRHAIRSSGVIFSGTVVKVDRDGSEPANATGITRITFRVQNAIRGVRRGQLLQISEWGGLWNAGERYRAGEQVLLFLYPNSKLGLTSPVGGALGRYAMDGPTRVLVNSPENRHLKPVELRAFTAAVRRAAKE